MTTKRLDAAGAAKKINQGAQPVIEFRTTDADLSQPKPPVQNPRRTPPGKLVKTS